MTMTGLKTAGAAVLLSIIIATPAFAQAAIQEPGAFAFYHPNADVLNGGSPTPAAATGAMASVPLSESNAYAYMGDTSLNRDRKMGSRHVTARADAAAGPEYGHGRRCIPAPRVGAFATQPWDNDTPCDPTWAY